MTEKKAHKQDQVSLGTVLRNAREEKNLSIEQVSQKTKIREDNLLAIERGESLDHIPHAYFRGYVACYAKILGLSADSLLSKITLVDLEAPKIAYSTGNSFQIKQSTHQAESNLSKTQSQNRTWIRFLALTFIILCVGLAFITLWPFPTSVEFQANQQQHSEHKLDSIINIS